MADPLLTPTVLRTAHIKPSWLLALGVIMIVLGLIACTYVFTATLTSVYVLGVLITIAGVLQLAHAWGAKRWQSVVVWSLSGFLYLVAGVLAIAYPIAGATTLTLIFGATLIASGAFRIWVWLQNRSTQSAGWLAMSGLLTLIVGLIIAGGWPDNSFWVLGIILGVDLLFQGWSVLLLGLALRSRQA